MQVSSVSDIKKELKHKDPNELIELVVRLGKFKKENKELIHYLLFERDNEHFYIESIKIEIDEIFENLNKSSLYLAKKTIRKAIRNLNKYIRYSGKIETEIDLGIHFLSLLKDSGLPISKNRVLENIYYRRELSVKKAIGKLHEDLQYDYLMELEQL